MSAGLCPKCLRRYPEDAASFCKADGTPLVPIDEARGAGSTWDRLPMAKPAEQDRGPVFDRAQPTAGPLSTIRGVVPPGLATEPPKVGGKGRELLRIVLLLLLAAALAAAIFLGLG